MTTYIGQVFFTIKCTFIAHTAAEGETPTGHPDNLGLHRRLTKNIND